MDEIGYIPKSLEAQERFLWWDFDQAILFILVMGMHPHLPCHALFHCAWR